MNFGQALDLLYEDKKVRRRGWNGKDMYIYLVPGSTFRVEEGRPLARYLPLGQQVSYRPHIDMHFPDGRIGVWSIAMGDILENDWEEAV